MIGTPDPYRERELDEAGVPATVLEGEHADQRVVIVHVDQLDRLIERLSNR